MSDYMLIVHEDEHAHASQTPSEMGELIAKRARFVNDLRRDRRLRDSGRLRPSGEGKRVRRVADAVRVEGGPFADDGKTLGAYYIVDAPSVEEATRIAAACPTLASDDVDVRPLMKGRVAGDKESKPGKVFVFAVLSASATEEAWVEVMDTIDAETSTTFPVDSFLGGLRLYPPTAGRRVATRGERRATLDGPFLETKEVIGGAFFLRMSSIDEAVRWAAASRFVVHGVLEIRELWRT